LDLLLQPFEFLRPPLRLSALFHKRMKRPPYDRCPPLTPLKNKTTFKLHNFFSDDGMTAPPRPNSSCRLAPVHSRGPSDLLSCYSKPRVYSRANCDNPLSSPSCPFELVFAVLLRYPPLLRFLPLSGPLISGGLPFFVLLFPFGGNRRNGLTVRSQFFLLGRTRM